MCIIRGSDYIRRKRKSGEICASFSFVYDSFKKQKDIKDMNEADWINIDKIEVWLTNHV